MTERDRFNSRNHVDGESMRRYRKILIALLVMAGSSARSDNIPVLNVKPLCHGITNQSSLQEGFRGVTYNECIKAEQGDREQIAKEWSTFSSSDKQHCTAEATMGGESSYTDLLTCLEMARDVRNLRNQPQSGSTAAGAQTGNKTRVKAPSSGR